MAMAKTSQANGVILDGGEQEVSRVTLQAIATLIQGLSPEKVSEFNVELGNILKAAGSAVVKTKL
jgi:hypothetical protein